MRRRTLAVALAFLAVAGASAASMPWSVPPQLAHVTPAPSSSGAAAASSGPCPADMSLVPLPGSDARACVDQYEAALVVVERGDETAPFPHGESVDGVDPARLRAIPARGIPPQSNVSAAQAAAACQGAGKRLCTFSEWRAACRGPEGNTYPYGKTYEPGACNEGRPSPLRVAPGAGVAVAIDDPALVASENTVAPGGQFDRCKSAYGNYDMHGNVHEWIDESPNPSDPRYGTFMGGFFAEARANGEGCSYRTIVHFKTYHDYSTGFRCCRDAN